MATAPVIRVVWFRSLRPGFDDSLRAEVAGLRGSRGLVGVVAGRHGPDELGSRLIAMAWASDAARSAALGAGVAPIASLADPLSTADVDIEDLMVRIMIDAAPGTAPRIVRALRGRIRPGHLAAYVEDARNGTLADRGAGRGPIALYLGTARKAPDEFLTVSTWADWEAIERATGGDIRRPLATRHPERIVSFDVTHYEAIEL